MRWTTLAVCAVCLLGLATSIPLPETRPETLLDQTDVQERLRSLQLDEPSTLEQVTRDKRTIAVLRQLFPGLSQIIDRKITRITQYLFRVIGRLVLRGGLGGGGGGGATAMGGGTSNRRITITLPTFPPDAEEDEDQEEVVTDVTTEEGATEESNTDTATQTELNPEDENQLAGAESQQNEVRVQYTGEEEEQDQDSAASGGNNAPDPAAAEVVSDDSAADESDRNKRLINFSLGGGASAGSSGGSGGGSGNFLFDIIRRTADRAARAAGTVYRVVAGTESLGVGLGVTTATKTMTSSRTNQTTMSTQMTNNGTTRALVAGSGNTESSDGGVVAEAGVEKDDGYQAGIPGPITRLFVIANRGIANLMQDLILRLAQTTERIVNFKARLITSII